MNFKKLSAIAFVSAAILAGASTLEASPRLSVYTSSITIEEDCSDTIIASATETFEATKGKIEKATLTLKKVSAEQALKAIKAFSGVEELRLSDVPVTDLNFLKEMPNLKELDISGDSEFAPIDISAISGNQKLEEVEFSSCKILDLAPISTCANLKKFTSYSSKILSNTISPLKDLANLEELSLYGTQVDDFAHLAPLAKLKKINVYATKPIEGGKLDYDHLSAIKSLEEIKAGLTDMTSVAFLKDLPKIKSIEFLAEEIKDLETLENCKSIEYIMFWSHHNTDLDGNKIGKAKSLKRLKYWSTPKASNWEGLGNLTNLEDLNIDGVKNCQTPDTAINTSFLASLTNLKKVTFREVVIKDLAKLPASIKEINIEQERIKPEDRVTLDCSTIAAPEATKLNIIGAKLTNVSSIVKNFPKIENLTLKKIDGIDNYDFLKELPKKVRVYLPKDTLKEDMVKELKEKDITINMW
jgi:Leucine-rich repeat (LRR) protein